MRNMLDVTYPGAGLIVGFLNSSPIILTVAGTTMGKISKYTPDFTKIAAGALVARLA
jgi:hypothetical protein